MKKAKVLQNCKQGKLCMGAYLNMFHAVTCQKQNKIT